MLYSDRGRLRYGDKWTCGLAGLRPRLVSNSERVMAGIESGDLQYDQGFGRLGSGAGPFREQYPLSPEAHGRWCDRRPGALAAKGRMSCRGHFAGFRGFRTGSRGANTRSMPPMARNRARMAPVRLAAAGASWDSSPSRIDRVSSSNGRACRAAQRRSRHCVRSSRCGS